MTNAAAYYETHRKLVNPDCSSEEFLRRVCNNGAVLPADKLEGAVFHLPVMCVGDPEAFKAGTKSPDWFGWQNKKYMIVATSPTEIDISYKQCLSSHDRAGKFLRAQLEEAGFDLSEVMLTHALRFTLPKYLKSYTRKHQDVCADLVKLDLEGCRPEVIITCGATAFKALYGSKAKLTTHRGDVLTYTYSDGTTAQVIPSVSHMSFMNGTPELGVFKAELKKAYELGNARFSMPTLNRDYTVCESVQQVSDLVERIRGEKPERIAFDTEFGNDVARDEFGYVLSIQLSWGYGKAACILLRKQVQDPDFWVVTPKGKPRKSDGRAKLSCKQFHPIRRCGVPLHTEEEERAIWKMTADLLNEKGWKLVAHHLRVDVEQFSRAGFPIDDRIEDGVDTMLIHHLLYGDESQGLDDLVRKYVPEFGNYWSPLEEWLDGKPHDGYTCRARNGALQYGYRDIPIEILIPYGLDDAASTWALGEKLEAELATVPSLYRLYWDHVAPTTLHLLDVQRHGILVDDERRMVMRETYVPALEHFLARAREILNWPEFNPGSDQNMRTALFAGSRYFGKKPAPEGARVLSLKPLMNTDKYPVFWTQLEKMGEAHLNTPSVRAEVLDILQGHYPDEEILIVLKHISVLGKLIRDYLSPIEMNEYGVPRDGKGVHNNIWADGRARTNLSQLTTTGRYTSKKANLQTTPKKQESAILEALVYYRYGISLEDYQRRTFDGKKDAKGNIIKPAYAGEDFIPPDKRVEYVPYKTVFISPPGYSLIEIDFKNAELFIWAYCSGDPELIKIVDSGRDLHSEVACSAFNLPPLAEMREAVRILEETGNIGPYKEWNERFKTEYGSERVAAKTVNFGIMYGRGAAALCREILKQGVPTTPEACQAIIQSVASAYPTAWSWLCSNAERAVEQEFIENAFGRRRYFTGANDMTEMQQSAVGREAKNSPIQGCVADLLARAGINFYRFKYRTKAGQRLDFKILLPIHDAFLFECKDEHVEAFTKVAKVCMSTANCIPGTDKYLKLDIEVMKRWGEH